MTFYEAALRVLEGAGRPLHFLEITEKSIADNLLSHVGKTPEQTMLSRLAAMARRTRDRRLVVTAKDTFALADWALPEDAEALAQTGLPPENPEEALPPLRPPERHPEPRTDNVRLSGRGERKRRRDEEQPERGRKRRFPPIPEVVFEILSEAGRAMRPQAIADLARSRELASDELDEGRLLTSLLEDNQRRIDVGRRPQFVLDQASGEVNLERAGSPTEAPPLELQAAFAAALGIPLEGGRPVLPKSAAPPPDANLEAAHAAARTAVKDARRAVARVLRRRLTELDDGTFEKVVVKLLHGLGYRELKMAKRSRDGAVLTARHREGSLELRYAVKLVPGDAMVDRRAVQELRRDLGHYSANIGLLLGPGELRSEARSEAVGQGALILLWCGDALGEKLLEAKAGVKATHVELFEIDDAFFSAARVDAEESKRRREERHRERRQRDPEDAAPRPSPVEEVPFTAVAAAEAAPSPHGDDAQDEGDDEEGDDDLEAAREFASGATDKPEGAPGSPEGGGEGRRRRRRRRRGRRRGGRAPDGAVAGGAPGGEPGASAQAPEEQPAPAPPPSDGGGEPG